MNARTANRARELAIIGPVERRGTPQTTATEGGGRTEIRAAARALTYGWGVIPVEVTIGRTTWRTSLFPKDEGYLVPIKDAVRKAEGLAPGDIAEVRLRAGR